MRVQQDCEIDQDADSDQVDELLAMCVKQALPHSDGEGDSAATSWVTAMYIKRQKLYLIQTQMIASNDVVVAYVILNWLIL